MKNALGAAAKTPALRIFPALLALLTAICLLAASAQAASPGGVTARNSSEEAPVYGTESPTSPTGAAAPTSSAPRKAMLVRGRAIAPLNAPPAVRKVIAAANKIRTRPYIWGGGHGRWWDRGYDCSGAVSFALHGGGFLGSPLPSGPMERWGAPGRGKWITVYANGGHAFAVIAGLRWDTAGNRSGTGPRWHLSPRSAVPGYFAARHPVGY